MDLNLDLEKYLNEEFMMKLAANAAKLAVILILMMVLLKITSFAVKRWKKRLSAKRSTTNLEVSDHEKEKRLQTITGLINKGLRIIIVSVTVLVALQTFGVSIGPLLASAGVLGLAIGFGAQNLVQDVISGFFVLFEDQVREGDVAIINGQAGTVESINFRTIVLRDLSGTVHFFRNGSINTVANMTKGWSAMVFDIGVAYKEDINKVMETMQQTFSRLKESDFGAKVLDEEMEIFGLDSFGDSAIIVKARIKTSPLEQWAVGRQYRKLLKEAFDAENIEIPFPHQSIYFGEASEPFKLKIEGGENLKLSENS